MFVILPLLRDHFPVLMFIRVLMGLVTQLVVIDGLHEFLCFMMWKPLLFLLVRRARITRA